MGFFGRALGAAAQGYLTGEVRGEGEAHRRALVDKQNELRQAALAAQITGKKDANAAVLERERLREKAQADEAIRKHAASVEHDINGILSDPEQQSNLNNMPRFRDMLLSERERAREVLIGKADPSTWTPLVPHPDHVVNPPGTPPAGPGPGGPGPGAAPLGPAPWTVLGSEGRTISPPDLPEMAPGARIATTGGAIAPEAADIVQRLPGLAPAFSGVDPNATSGETEIPLPHGAAPVESPLEHYQRLVREGPPKFVQGLDESAKQFATRKQREGFLWKQQVQAAKDAALAGPKVQRLQTDADFAKEINRQKVAGMEATTLGKRAHKHQIDVMTPVKVERERSTIQHQRTQEKQTAGRMAEQKRVNDARLAFAQHAMDLRDVKQTADLALINGRIKKMREAAQKVEKAAKMDPADAKLWALYTSRFVRTERTATGSHAVNDPQAFQGLKNLARKYGWNLETGEPIATGGHTGAATGSPSAPAVEPLPQSALDAAGQIIHAGPDTLAKTLGVLKAHNPAHHQQLLRAYRQLKGHDYTGAGR